MEGFIVYLLVFLLLFVGMILFAIYFVTKVLGFFVNATRLYRAMIRRHDAMISLLIDLRDNTKRIEADTLIAQLGDESASELQNDLTPPRPANNMFVTFDCPQCGNTIYQRVAQCMFCQKALTDEEINTAVAAYRTQKGPR